ncbi:MAG: hypothetical protein ACHQ50_00505 [Fimbriimonadales bacterium]
MRKERATAVGCAAAIGLAIGALGVFAFEWFVGMSNDYVMYERYLPYVTRNRIVYPLGGAAIGAVCVLLFRRKR